MSVSKETYLIAGYDLTGFETDKFDDWKYTNDGEKYTCNQTRGQIQLFDDPMCGCYVYLGYILGICDLFQAQSIDVDLIQSIKPQVRSVLNELYDKDVISEEVLNENKCKFEVLLFEECY